MRRQLELALKPAEAFTETLLHHAVAKALRVQQDELTGLRLIKRSIDSRSRQVLVRLRVEAILHEEWDRDLRIRRDYPEVKKGRRVLVAGAGPAGLFAALQLIESGLKPVLLERGKDVHERKKDIALLNRQHRVHPDSNYCFGEGGAGTFSDGKLYTRSIKRGNTGRLLETLVYHGASPDILIDAHPHIGSDRLPAIVEAIRQTIQQAGGEVHFNRKVTGLAIKNGKLTGVTDQHGNLLEGEALLLATGHSARELFELLLHLGLPLECKPFALGVRVEHPQTLIDRIQYHTRKKDPFLPAASYQLVHQASGRGVFSFCMCPGGIIVPSATGEGQVVVNGMSNARRNSPFANSGIVVSIQAEDLKAFHHRGALMGLAFQEHLEKISFLAGGSCQRAPAQRLTDFLGDRMSDDLPGTSYQPGLTPYPLQQVFPSFLTTRLQEGFRAFDRKMPGFLTRDAVVLATESRTSSPVRIPRDPETLRYSGLENVFPCGEGAGYAGGIVSSALDGEKAALAVSRYLAREGKK